MTYSPTCQRIRVGGSISGSTLTGGTVLETHGKNFLSWDGLLGYGGKRGGNIPVLGRDGTRHQPNKPYREKLMTLQIVAYDRDDDGIITMNGRMDHLEDNIDEILDLLTGDEDEQIILERVTHLGSSLSGEEEETRWIRVEALDPASFARGPVFGVPHSSYAITLPVVAAYPFWQSETRVTDVVDGANVIVTNEGNARDSAAVYTFAGDGVLTHNGTGLTMTVAGSSNPVVVDIGAGTIMSNGARADRLMTPSRREWMRLLRGDNDMTSTVEVTINHRHQYQT